MTSLIFGLGLLVTGLPDRLECLTAATEDKGASVMFTFEGPQQPWMLDARHRLDYYYDASGASF